MDANQIIDALGGTAEVARLCNVKSPSVSEWRTNGIPPARLQYLRLLRPEVFADQDDNSEPLKSAA
jgi:hypothetical protein